MTRPARPNIEWTKPRRGRREARPLADLVDPCIAPALRRKGFGESEIVLHWPQIVGPRLAGVCEPLKLQWPPGPAEPSPEATADPASLVVRVEGAFALEVQHMAATIIERVNQHLGWRCVGRLLLRQGPTARQAGTAQPVPAPPEAVARAQAAVTGVEDEALRAALMRLGSRVLTPGRRR